MSVSPLSEAPRKRTGHQYYYCTGFVVVDDIGRGGIRCGVDVVVDDIGGGGIRCDVDIVVVPVCSSLRDGAGIITAKALLLMIISGHPLWY